MLPPSDYELRKNYELNTLPAVLERGRRRVLLREAGLEQRRWISCQVCKSLWRLGHSLVVAGTYLEKRYQRTALRPSGG